MGCSASASAHKNVQPVDNPAQTKKGRLDFSALLRKEASPCRIERTEERGICVFQLVMLLDFMARCTKAGPKWREAAGDEDLLQGWEDCNPARAGGPLHMNSVNLYNVNHTIIKPATESWQCSYVEAIAQDAAAQKPVWFVSHWWGEPVAHFVQCLLEHVRLRGLAQTVAYWVCAYANNQWCLSAEIVDDPAESSFRKAMRLSVGTLSILDPDAVVFTRIWCCYEIATTLKDSGDKLFDLATVTEAGGVAVLSSGTTALDDAEGALPQWQHCGGAVAAKSAREKAFPLELMAKGIEIFLERGEASVEADRLRILNAIVGSRDFKAPPPSQHAEFDSLNQALRWRLAQACYEQAHDAGKVDILSLRDLQPPQTKGIADECADLASAFQDQAKYGLSMELHEKSLEIRLKALGPDHPDVGESYNNMANVRDSQVQLESAMELHEKSLEIRLKALGPDHPDVSESYNNMANVRVSQGQLESAMELYEKSLEIRLKALGPDHPDVGASYNNMANVRDSQGQLESAMELHEKSLEIRLKALGPDHPDVGASYNNMAMVRESQGQLESAMELHEKSLEIRLKALGPDHPNVGASYNSMAMVRQRQGELESAMELHEKSLEIKLKALGPDHPNVGDSYYNMASLRQSQGEGTQAAELFFRAADVYKACYGPEHAETQDAQERAVVSQQHSAAKDSKGKRKSLGKTRGSARGKGRGSRKGGR